MMPDLNYVFHIPFAKSQPKFRKSSVLSWKRQQSISRLSLDRLPTLKVINSPQTPFGLPPLSTKRKGRFSPSIGQFRGPSIRRTPSPHKAEGQQGHQRKLQEPKLIRWTEAKETLDNKLLKPRQKPQFRQRSVSCPRLKKAKVSAWTEEDRIVQTLTKRAWVRCDYSPLS
jgi:hypothetical protein